MPPPNRDTEATLLASHLDPLALRESDMETADPPALEAVFGLRAPLGLFPLLREPLGRLPLRLPRPRPRARLPLRPRPRPARACPIATAADADAADAEAAAAAADALATLPFDASRLVAATPPERSRFLL